MKTACGSAAAGASRTKWAASVASALIQCSAGANYCFSVYSQLLKSSHGYDQSTLDSVAFFKDVGSNVGVLSGLLISSPSSFGRPWFVLAVGAAQALAGYLLMWLSVVGAVPRPPPAAMCAYMLVAAHAQTFLNTGNVVVAVQNFPEMRGSVIGIMKGFIGISGAILVQIYRTILNGDQSSFLLMLALLPSTLTFLLMSFVEVHNQSSSYEKKFIDSFSLVSLVIAGYLMVVIIGEPVITKSSMLHILSLVPILLLLLSLLAIAIKTHTEDSEGVAESSSHESIRLIDDENQSGVPEHRIYDPQTAENTRINCDHISADKLSRSNVQNLSNREPLLVPWEESLSTSQAMMTLDFWLLFIAMACGMGSGLATVNNIGQIGASLGYTSLETSTLISLWSIWNFLGRFGTGYISDHFLRVRGWPRPLFILVTLLAMSVGHAVISSGLPGSLYAGSIIVGLCYGSQWSMMPSITSEIFGLRDFGTIFNTITIASPCGSYILSVRVIGYIYDRESSFSESGSESCTGRHCFMLSFLIMASVTLLGSVVALVLFYRTRRFYKQATSRNQNLQE